MSAFYTRFVAPYAKAWVAAVLPITAGIGIDAVTAASVDAKGHVALVAFGVVQFLAVYAKRNTVATV